MFRASSSRNYEILRGVPLVRRFSQVGLHISPKSRRTMSDHIDKLVHRHYPHAVHGCGGEGEFRPSGHADGAGPGRLHPLHAALARFDPADARLAEPRPLHPVGRHASMLLYSMLFLANVRAAGWRRGAARRSTISRTFARLDSRTAPGTRSTGTPPGVEVTTGPLGPGCRHQRRHGGGRALDGAPFQPPGFELFDYDVYAICSDGDMMEGISSEAASLAGHLRAPNLCWIYDFEPYLDRGRTDLAFTEDVGSAVRGLRLERAARALMRTTPKRSIGAVDRFQDRGTGRR